MGERSYELDEAIERLRLLAEPQDITPNRFVGVISALEGWKLTQVPDATYEAKLHRATQLKEWSYQAQEFFLDLPNTAWDCYFAVGDNQLQGHELLPLGNGYALFAPVPIPARSVYRLNYGLVSLVTKEATNYDLPEDDADLHQLYVGDTRMQVALSFNQFSSSLLDNGVITLIPRNPMLPPS